MTRKMTWVAAGVGLTAVLATGLLVVAQMPTNQVPPPALPVLGTPPVPQVPVAVNAAMPTPPPPPGNVIQAGYAQNPEIQPATSPPLPPPTIIQQNPNLQRNNPQPPAQNVTAIQPPKANGDLVQELVQIINETKSVDTFFVTTKLLEDMGVKARVAVPAIIRNAERLELFKDAFLQTEKDGEKQKRVEAASMIVDSLAKIMNPGQGGASRPAPLVVPSAVPPASSRTPDPLVTPTSGRSERPPALNGSSNFPPAGVQ